MSQPLTETAMPTGADAGLPVIDSARLFATGREVRIRHAGEEYRLRLTSNNKLILTK